MRIRKRHVLLSSTHFPVTPPSDPHQNNRSPVVVQLGDATPTAPDPSSPPQQRGSAVLSLDRNQPSDQPLPPINGLDHPSATRQHSKQDPSVEDGGGREEEEKEEEDSGGDSEEKKINHSRKGRISGGSSQTLPLPLSPSSASQDNGGRWCEEEKAIPFKKRRGAFENSNNNTGQLGSSSSSKKTKAKMKTKMNKKVQLHNNDIDDDGEEEEEEKKAAVKAAAANGKKRGRGSALMEGSRCSRVNGRGWRCCQQTLVGYSLCEHHLGKGRLRSMTSVRSRSTSLSVSVTAPPTNKVQLVVQQHHNNNNHDVETTNLSSSLLAASSPPPPPDEKQTNSKCVAAESDDEKKKPVVMTSTKNKRMKLGTVKARSISSLLGQTNTTTTAGIALSHHETSANK